MKQKNYTNRKILKSQNPLCFTMNMLMYPDKFYLFPPNVTL